jgi:uncharacterized protein (DUF1684 family)
MGDYQAEIDSWRSARLAALAAEDGWLNLTDRVEVKPGRMSVGAGPDNDVVLSTGPEHLGLLEVDDEGQAQIVLGDQRRTFQPVPDNSPRLKLDGLLLEMTRQDGLALRVRDIRPDRRVAMPRIDSFPLDPDWRVVADWLALKTPEQLGINLVTGAEAMVRITHQARFRHEGHEICLLPTHWKSGVPMFVFRDRTSGRQSYGASRFLYGEVRGDQVILDFNKAFSPPCAFTDLAVCPLPPRQNILDIEVRAGEMAPQFT